MNITKSTIDNARPRDKDYLIMDAGFGIRVYKSGFKSFVVSYYDFNNKQKREVLGNVNSISIKEARMQADRKRLDAKQYSLGKYAFDETFIRYLDDKNTSWKPNSQKVFNPLVDKYIKTSFLWVQRDLNNIQKQQFFKYFEGLYKTPDSQKNNIYLLLNGFFKWCVKKGLIDKNPIEGVWDVVPSKQRERVLTMEELHALWNASHTLEPLYKAYIRMLILTGQRRSEVANMELSELDLNQNIWVIPKEKTKGKREHQLPLTTEMLNLIQPLVEIGNRYLFNTHSRNGFTQFDPLKKKLECACKQEALQEDWRLHDIRRSVATHMVSLGIDPFLVKRILNHSIKSDLGVTSIYVKNTYLKEKRSALSLWSDHFY